jgi:hypothetical protein
MAARIGHMTLDLLARVPGNEPIVIGTVEVPVTGRIDPTRPGVRVDIPDLRAALAPLEVLSTPR